MLRSLLFSWLFLLLTPMMLAGQESVPLENDIFKMTIDPENAHLPVTLSLKDGNAELLEAGLGLDLAFVSFEFRKKIYYDENRRVWGHRESPRFVTFGQTSTMTQKRTADSLQIDVSYRTPFAQAQRTMTFNSKTPAFEIAYRLAFLRDLVLHETHNLAIGMKTAKGFTRMTVYDARADEPVTITADGVKRPSHAVSLLDGGPVLFTDPESGVSLLLVGSHAGDVPVEPPARLLEMKAGQVIELKLHAFVGKAGDAAMAEKMLAAWKAMGRDRKAFALVKTAEVLARRKKIAEAEQALLLAAKLREDYAQPYASLAALRRDNKLPGQTQAWAEAGYRMPYNYGYMLSASGLYRQEGLTEAQRRQHLFNLLIAVENTAFYADYYIWAARGFLDMKMYAQACAMYRQALWALEHTPRPEKYKQKYRERFKQEIEKLEAKMLGQTATDLPPLIPVRPERAN